MKSIQIKELKVSELGFNELQRLNGGGCSFAYDVGFVIRILGLGLSGPRAGFIHGEIATYEANCN
jgi:hypothetical protein